MTEFVLFYGLRCGLNILSGGMLLCSGPSLLHASTCGGLRAMSDLYGQVTSYENE